MTVLVCDETYKEHLTGEGHPESPARYDAVMEALSSPDFSGKLRRLKPRAAVDDDLIPCHAPEYLEIVEEAIRRGDEQLPTGDTVISPRSLEVARLAAGGVITAVDAVIEGSAQNAFCAIRPPGHHAGTYRGSGFCVFNNVAVGARHAQRRHGIERVLIIDWDVHHGNGTQEIFYSDDTVFFFSTHQSPWYPNTGYPSERGTGAGLGFTMNCPFPAGAGREQIVGAFTERLVPAAESFKPQLVMISAGFDSRLGDPLGEFRLTDDDFAELTRIVMGIARDHADGRLISVLEGGYNLSGLNSATASHVETLCGVETAAGTNRSR